MRWKRTAGSAGGALAALLAALAASSSPAGASGPLAHITRVGSAPPSQSISLVFPLLADHAGLAPFARSVSTPGSVSYGQFEPIAQLSARFGASARARRHVLAYLHRVGATGVK